MDYENGITSLIIKAVISMPVLIIPLIGIALLTVIFSFFSLADDDTVTMYKSLTDEVNSRCDISIKENEVLALDTVLYDNDFTTTSEERIKRSISHFYRSKEVEKERVIINEDGSQYIKRYTVTVYRENSLESVMDKLDMSSDDKKRVEIVLENLYEVEGGD